MSIVSKSSTENISNTYINTSSAVSSQITTTCFATGNQLQKISVNNTAGNVNIKDSNFSQIMSAMASCFGTVASKNTDVSKIQAVVDQTAVAENKGFDPLAMFGSLTTVAFIIGGIVIFFVVFKSFSSKSSPKPSPFGSISKPLSISNKLNNKPTIVLIIVAIVCFLVLLLSFVTFKNSNAVITQYSMLIKTLCPSAVVISEENVNSIEEAAEAAIKNSKCVAFDFIGYTLDGTGKYLSSLSTTPKAIYYSSIPTSCKITQDNLELIYFPEYGSGSFDPTSTNVPQRRNSEYRFPISIWLNTSTSDWFVIDQVSGNWIRKGNFSSPFAQSNLSAAFSFSPSSASKLIVEPILKLKPASFKVTYGTLTKMVDGPGYLTFTPPYINSSGIINRKIRLPVTVGALFGCVASGCAAAWFAVSHKI